MTKMLSAGTLGKKGGWAYIRGWAYYRASTVYLFKCVFIVISDFIVAYCLYGDDQVVLPYYMCSEDWTSTNGSYSLTRVHYILCL